MWCCYKGQKKQTNEQWNRIEWPETDPHIYGHQVYDTSNPMFFHI